MNKIPAPDKKIRGRIIHFRLMGLSFRRIADLLTVEGRKMSYQRVHSIFANKNNEYRKLMEERLAMLRELQKKNTDFCSLCGENFPSGNPHKEKHQYLKGKHMLTVIVCEACGVLLRRMRRKKGGIGKFHNLFFIKAEVVKNKGRIKNKRTKNYVQSWR